MTFLDIFQDVARRCDKNPTAPDPETNTRLRTFINDRYRELMRIPGVINLRDEVFSNAAGGLYAFRSVVGVNRVVVPPSITAITSLLDTTHQLKLQQRPMAWIRERDPGGVSSGAKGTPTYYAVLNNQGVLNTAGGDLRLGSDSTQDVGGVVTIEYADYAGAFRAIQATLDGTTSAGLPFGTAMPVIFRMSVDAPQVGTITLKSQSLGTVYVAIPPNAITSYTNNLHTSRGWVLWLWPTPSGVFDYTVDGTRPRAALINEMDEPALPEDFHTLLVWGACEDELIHMDDNRAQIFADRWKKDVAALKGFLHQVRGERLIPNSRGARWSPLGGNYPPWQ